ncbi:Hypothetical predicted protein [Lecanosticta acicola]|uniref:Uncharacterized protein n=1 Tax=Lecanosticta acicola TaxID=111012 RepID=A0AAI9EBK6_9PEZI|nr:Hypothetical predicted protein [Lecanosticta acicola]
MRLLLMIPALSLVLAAPVLGQDYEPLLQLNNYCRNSLWVSDGNETENTPPVFELKTGTAYVRPIVGIGNVLGVTRSKDYYDVNNPKLILGTSVTMGTLWWTVSPLDGDPFKGDKFSITTPKSTNCGNATGYDNLAHNCKVGKYTLQFNPCIE